jgi:hypothetical protein
MIVSYIFIALEINILYRNVYVLYITVYTVDIYSAGPYFH